MHLLFLLEMSKAGNKFVGENECALSLDVRFKFEAEACWYKRFANE